ncbi:MAG: pyrroline-5-carboxylate reductase [Syntrophorhabdaceae bacterium]|nr:pyrroline-5-carboxylate reductase [Syntrophorhabdaceae bacterium]
MEKIGVIGTGNMGESFVKGMIKGGIDPATIICNDIKKERLKIVEDRYGVICTDNIEVLVREARYTVLAIKPQDSNKLLRLIAPFVDKRKVIISIMAGVTINNIVSRIGKEVKVVRVMPNISLKVGEAAICVAYNEIVEKDEIDYMVRVLSFMGKVIEVEEEMMDTITAIGGSGPAFFLFFLESMIDAGVKMGLSRDKSKTIAIQVVKGTIKILEEEDIHPTVLKEMITSPGGTTIAGLSYMEEEGLKGRIIKAIEKAKIRAGELSIS